MHIEDAGALPTTDHVKVLPNSQLQLVARLPHIQFAAGPAPNSINDIAGSRQQDLIHVKTNSRLGVKNVGKANKTDLRYPKRLPPGLFFIQVGMDQDVLQVFVSPKGGDHPAGPQGSAVFPRPVEVLLDP